MLFKPYDMDLILYNIINETSKSQWKTIWNDNDPRERLFFVENLKKFFFNFRPDRFPSVSETSEYRKPIGKIV